MNVKPRFGIYTRISNDKEGAGLGVQRQEEDCRQLAESLGGDVVKVYQDNDISAYQRKKARTGYNAMLKDLESGVITGVIAWHTDRLHRRNAELEPFIDLIERTKAQVSTVRGGQLDLATPDGRMMARMLGSIAQREVEHGRDRVTRAKQQAAEAGKWRGGPRPFGYEADGVTVRESEERAVRDAADLVIAGQSLRSIAKELNARGYRSTSKKALPLTERSVREILLRPRNAGLVEYQGTVTGNASWPAILPEDTWRAVVSILRNPSRTTNTGSDRKWLGSGLFVCGVCGGLVRTTMSNGRRRVYRCKQGSHVSREQAQVDDWVRSVMAERLADPGIFDRVAVPMPNKVEPLRSEAAALRARRDQLAVDYADGHLTGAQLRVATGRLDGKIAEAERALMEAGAAGGLADLVSAPDPAKMFLKASLGRQRAIIDALVTVTLLPAKRGRPKGWTGGAYFDPETVRIARRGD